MKHFGIQVREGKYGFYLTRENYVAGTRKNTLGGAPYSQEWIDKQIEAALLNFDINMKRYAKLDHDEFNSAIESFLSENPEFEPVKDLHDWSLVAGHYVLVLDKYCQAYPGCTHSIKNRVLQHWAGTKSLDRLLFGTIESSTLSIDSFRSLDTTRIYACPNERYRQTESSLMEDFPRQFLLNRAPLGIFEKTFGENISEETREAVGRYIEQSPLLEMTNRLDD